jgi:DNA repair protein RecN (Recombination protein N)
MLQHLEITNIAIIEKLSMDFGEGLNILTGETGAGKSIIIDSINALLGMRTSRELIRSGEEKASVEGIFVDQSGKVSGMLKELGIDPEPDGTIIISREITLSGRNICRINGKLVSVSALKEIGEGLIDMHGQFDSQSLMRTEMHSELLDAFGGEAIRQLKEEFQCLAAEYRQIDERIRRLSGYTSDRERKIDLLRYQVDEIERAKLYEGEDEDLKSRRTLLANSEKIFEVLSEVYQLIAAGNDTGFSVADGINHALSRIGQISGLSGKFSDIHDELENITYRLDDITHEIRKLIDSIEFSRDELDTVERRIDYIQDLKRKYGAAISDIIRYCENARKELEEILNNEEVVARLNEDLNNLRKDIFRVSGSLTGARRNAARTLEEMICNELKDLEMKGARFKVSIETQILSAEEIKEPPAAGGYDSIEFLISVNEGEPLKPLSKTASGGEMSRIMLAIKKTLADVDRVPTLIFDEIDIGIGGQTAYKVGEKLRFISGNHQVICVTHLAQIACNADIHYHIDKITEEGRTKTIVRRQKKCLRLRKFFVK